MNKAGKLSDRDRQTILRAAQIVDKWVAAQIEQGNTIERSYATKEADAASMALRELLFQTRNK